MPNRKRGFFWFLKRTRSGEECQGPLRQFDEGIARFLVSNQNCWACIRHWMRGHREANEFCFCGSRDGVVVRALASHQCGPGSIPGLGVICGLSLLLVLILAPRVFLRVLRVFLPPQKLTFLNSNSISNSSNV